MTFHKKILFFTIFSLLTFTTSYAQVGEHRSVFSLGINGGYIASNIGFSPKVNQKMYLGYTSGLSLRYICEKYFNTICSIYGEINYAKLGWTEDIQTSNNQPVINSNGKAESYKRTINYIQIPIMAHLAWGKEQDGINFFFKAGPQIGYFLNESINKNFIQPNLSKDGTGRSSNIIAQEKMPVENKLDYGIAAGIGIEYSKKNIGHFIIEARYYYGLGNIYANTKKDYFGKSNLNNIIIKAIYLFDLTKPQ